MRKSPWKTYAFWIILSLATGIVSAILSRDATAQYAQFTAKPPLSPPAIVFPIVWTVLYILMGISAARVRLAAPSGQSSPGINLFVIQLILNFFWSLIFFNAQAYGFAFFWLLLLWLTVAAMILEFAKTDVLAARLQIPYLLWLTFAAYLNFGVWQLA